MIGSSNFVKAVWQLARMCSVRSLWQRHLRESGKIIFTIRLSPNFQHHSRLFVCIYQRVLINQLDIRECYERAESGGQNLFCAFQRRLQSKSLRKMAYICQLPHSISSELGNPGPSALSPLVYVGPSTIRGRRLKKKWGQKRSKMRPPLPQ